MAPVLNFLNFQASTGASEAQPRYVLDCVAVKLHNMKAIPSTGDRIPAIGLGTASGFSRAARTPEECYRGDAHCCTSKLISSSPYRGSNVILKPLSTSVCGPGRENIDLIGVSPSVHPIHPRWPSLVPQQWSLLRQRQGRPQCCQRAES